MASLAGDEIPTTVEADETGYDGGLQTVMILN
jgi:hypothetical protein